MRLSANGIARSYSNYRGVSSYNSVKAGGLRKFSATICVRKHHYRLGSFADEEAAARAYDAVARIHHGTRAKLNFSSTSPELQHVPHTVIGDERHDSELARRSAPQPPYEEDIVAVRPRPPREEYTRAVLLGHRVKSSLLRACCVCVNGAEKFSARELLR